MVYIQCDPYKRTSDPHLCKMRTVGHLFQQRKPVINMEPLKSVRKMLVQPEKHKSSVYNKEKCLNQLLAFESLVS
jgi:hypothetical protein